MTMREALQAAMPEHVERVPLARRITSLEQVKAMTDADLELLDAQHDQEITTLTGAIEARGDGEWARRARQAMRLLQVHKHWIRTERKERKKNAKSAGNQEMGQALKALASAKVETANKMAEIQRAAAEARMARIAAANDQDRQDMLTFKAVAREVLGAEMYEHLWELTRQRIAQAKQAESARG